MFKPPALFDDFIDGGNVSVDKQVEGIVCDAFEHMRYLLSLGHVFVNQAAKGDDVVNIRDVRFGRRLCPSSQLISRSYLSCSGVAKKVTDLLLESVPAGNVGFVRLEPHPRWAIKVKKHVGEHECRVPPIAGADPFIHVKPLVNVNAILSGKYARITSRR